METVSIFNWDGRYVGFLYEGRLYDKDGLYQGWVDAKKHVWRWDGSYLGEVKHENYILRSVHQDEMDPRMPKPYPHPPIPPTPRRDRPPKPPLNGWVDALMEEISPD